MGAEQDYVSRMTAQMLGLGVPEVKAREFLDEEKSLGARGFVQRFLGATPLLESELERLSQKTIIGEKAILELSEAIREYGLHKLEALGLAAYGIN